MDLGPMRKNYRGKREVSFLGRVSAGAGSRKSSGEGRRSRGDPTGFMRPPYRGRGLGVILVGQGRSKTTNGGDVLGNRVENGLGRHLVVVG